MTIWEELGTGSLRNLSKYHTSLHLHGCDSVGVSHGSSEWGWERLLVDIPPIEKVERVVFMVWERPHLRLDFLTVWNSIDESSKRRTHTHIYRTSTFLTGTPASTSKLHRHELKHTPLLSLRFPPCQIDALTCKHAHTHSRGCFCGMWDRASLALKEAWLSSLTHSLSPACVWWYIRTHVLMQCPVGSGLFGACGHLYTLTCGPNLSVCKCAHTLDCWLRAHASGRLDVNPVIPLQQTTPGLKMDLLELSALLVVARWLCSRWFISSSSFATVKNWFGLILNGFRTSAQYFTLNHRCGVFLFQIDV